MKRFEVLEHTADLALRAWGRDLTELTRNAADGMLALLYRRTPPEPRQWLELVVTAESAELVLQHALRELLYLLEDQGMAAVRVEVLQADAVRARLRVGLTPLVELKDYLRLEIKAVTRHGLQIEDTPEGLEVTLVFDV